MNTPEYHIDSETQELLESVLNMAAIVADAQLSDDACEEAYSLLNAVADRFLIYTHVETADNNTVKHLHTRPRFRVIVNNDEPDTQ